jgi:quercetin dioxygenase-like cupin family protein
MAATKQVNSPSAWPESLDALAAAPGNHSLLLENEHVRVLDTRIKAGERTPVHTHRWPAALYVLSWSDFVRYDDQGRVLANSAAAG